MSQTPTRILALDPTTKGFGYVILELPFRLFAWGLAHISGNKQTGALDRFTKLLDHSHPQAVVLEDLNAPGARRRHRVEGLIDLLSAQARERGLAVHTISRAEILERFSSAAKRATKHSIAQDLARLFPELAPKIPPRRKAWMSQDERMAIFDALALAVTHANL